jgi:hypothetical protein
VCLVRFLAAKIGVGVDFNSGRKQTCGLAVFAMEIQLNRLDIAINGTMDEL